MIWAKRTVTKDPMYRFTPQPDITAYELAIIAVRAGSVGFHGGDLYASADNPIPDNLLRHFTRQE